MSNSSDEQILEKPAGSLHLDFASPIPSSTQLEPSPFPRRAARLDASPLASGDAVGASLLLLDVGFPGGMG